MRVLAIGFSQDFAASALPSEHDMFSMPESIGHLKHLRYFAFHTSWSCRVILPSTLTKLYHIQVLDFEENLKVVCPSADLINLRHVFCGSELKFPNIGSLISLQTLPGFTARNKKGYEVQQLKDLNKLNGKLYINGLGNVKSKEEALEANLPAKERLTFLSLSWGDGDGDPRCSPEVEAEVLEGLCPPVGLEKLRIWNYGGSRYPNWMVGKQNGGPKDLQELFFYEWSQLGPAPDLEAFIHLRSLRLFHCSWEALPGNMERLLSLKRLDIYNCLKIRSLPILPQYAKPPSTLPMI